MIRNSTRISRAGRETYEAAKSSVDHLRPRIREKFLLQVQNEIIDIEKLANKETILSQAKQLSGLNWALLLPFFNAAVKIPAQKNIFVDWAETAVRLASYDIDASITFLDRTPEALKSFDNPDKLITWGKNGLDTFKAVKNKKKYGNRSKLTLSKHQNQTPNILPTNGDFFLIRQFVFPLFHRKRPRLL